MSLEGESATIIEVKRHLDGREERFETELVYRARGALVVLYRMPESRWGPVDSYGCYWADRTYVCYYMVRAEGSPDVGREVVTRFDVAREIEITDGEVRFLDLLLDLVVEDGRCRAGRTRTRWPRRAPVGCSAPPPPPTSSAPAACSNRATAASSGTFAGC